ncbi:MAG: phage tail protein [Clostridia bacterium]|jgi:phage tail sheath protein|nr:phage tail protein [Clostridia bacterium]DAO96507.1 MAG TPA: tail sheath protein [Caudoviricetes sp.]DAY80458.1 MAG TPA: tail sheath protein [Caudoviricetes sp.]
MALGGGTFISQNKKLPGSYINFASAQNASSSIGERGIAAMAIEMDWGKDGEIIEVTSQNFAKDSLKIFGYDYSNEKLKGLRDLFKNVKKAYFYRLNSGNKATTDIATAKCSGTRGNDIRIVVAKNIDDDTKYDVTTYLGTKEVDKQTVKEVSELVDNDYVTFSMETLEVTAGKSLEGGTNGDVSGEAHQNFLDKLESYQVNAIGCTVKDESTSNLYVQYAKRLRDEQGIKFQVVLFNNAANYEGVVNVKNTTVEDESALVYWVTGVIAGCEINKSNTNKTYDGEYTINADYTQAQLETSIDNGEFVLHKVGDEIRVLVDINSLVDTTTEKGEEFKSNQTIRVLDQIASDVASVFNSKYLGKIANNEAGRTSLWSDIIALFKDYQTLQAIENFEDADISVEIGNDKKSVTINTNVQVINAMEKLYMTVVVE